MTLSELHGFEALQDCAENCLLILQFRRGFIF